LATDISNLIAFSVRRHTAGLQSLQAAQAANYIRLSPVIM